MAKRDIVELLLARSDIQRAIRADDELPELVYPEFHQRLLRDLGLDPALLQQELGAQGPGFSPGPNSRRRSLAGRA